MVQKRFTVDGLKKMKLLYTIKSLQIITNIIITIKKE